MSGSSRRRAGVAVSLAIVALAFVLAAALGSGLLALVGSVALLVGLLAVDRYPGSRDW